MHLEDAPSCPTERVPFGAQINGFQPHCLYRTLKKPDLRFPVCNQGVEDQAFCTYFFIRDALVLALDFDSIAIRIGNEEVRRRST